MSTDVAWRVQLIGLLVYWQFRASTHIYIHTRLQLQTVGKLVSYEKALHHASIVCYIESKPRWKVQNGWGAQRQAFWNRGGSDRGVFFAGNSARNDTLVSEAVSWLWHQSAYAAEEAVWTEPEKAQCWQGDVERNWAVVRCEAPEE